MATESRPKTGETGGPGESGGERREDKVNAFLCLPVSLRSPVRLFVLVIDTCTGQIGRLSKNHSAGWTRLDFDWSAGECLCAQDGKAATAEVEVNYYLNLAEAAISYGPILSSTAKWSKNVSLKGSLDVPLK